MLERVLNLLAAQGLPERFLSIYPVLAWVVASGWFLAVGSRQRGVGPLVGFALFVVAPAVPLACLCLEARDAYRRRHADPAEAEATARKLAELSWKLPPRL